MTEKKFHPAGALIACPKCGKGNRLPMQVHVGLLPVSLKCPHCEQITAEITSIKQLPKVQPTGIENSWSVEAIEPIASDEVEEPDSTITSEHEQSFQRHAEIIEGVMLQGMEAIANLTVDLEQFQNAFLQHFQEQKQLLHLYSVKVDERELERFVTNPITALRIKCNDPVIQEYTRLFVYPRFLQAEFGFRIDTEGPLRIEVCNPFTMLHYPLSAWLCKYLKLPAPLDLHLIGNKIVGSTLPHCWRDIPGTVEDYDHTFETPSLRIATIEGWEARCWLAKHAIKPWPAREIGEGFRRVQCEAELLIEQQVEWKACYQALCRSGRVGLFSEDVMELRKIAVALASCLKGTKLTILSRTDDDDAYKAVKLAVPTNSVHNEWIVLDSSHVDFRVDRPEEVTEKIQVFGTIILDCLYSVNPVILKCLQRFQGNLIVLSTTPIRDFTASAEQDQLVHSLVAEQVYLYPSDSKRAARYDSPIIQALRGLNEQKWAKTK